MLYLNAYAVTRHYGGPEEGGWWYNSGEPLASIPIDSHKVLGAGHEYQPTDLAEGCDQCGLNFNEHYCEEVIDQEHLRQMEAQLKEKFDYVSEGSIYSVNGGSLLEISLEEQFAAYWPSERPRFE